MSNHKLLFYFCFPFISGASGGGNNFLKSLRNEFKKNGRLAESEKDAHIIIFNSHHACQNVYRLKMKFPDKTFVHRVDGPMSAYNDAVSEDLRDYIVYRLNKDVADATIFQSQWSQIENEKRGIIIKSQRSAIIWNAPNPLLFTKKTIVPNTKKRRIVASGWSTNRNKGLDTYLWIDRHLDFSQYEVTFIGNINATFSHIKKLPPLSPDELGKKLKEYDFYLFPSRKESCSNALMEALHTGLPTVAYDGGSNREIIPEQRWLFDQEDKIPSILNYMQGNYVRCSQQINLPSLEEVSKKYDHFSKQVFESGYRKKLSLYQYMKALSLLNATKLKAKFCKKYLRNTSNSSTDR